MQIQSREKRLFSPIFLHGDAPRRQCQKATDQKHEIRKNPKNGENCDPVRQWRPGNSKKIREMEKEAKKKLKKPHYAAF